VLCRLYPGKKSNLGLFKVTDDRFVLKVEGTGREADLEALRRLFQEYHASGVQETE
jgi:hypothetical protein